LVTHALLQDAAYDSILKSRRKQLHAEVARVLSERWPETERSAPELLAYHYTVAELHQLAAPLWLRAGEAATQRFALAEGITHLFYGMAALEGIRVSTERDLLELSIRTALGPALVAQRGWAHPEVARALEPAWKPESLRCAEELLKAAAETGDDSLEIVGHRAAASAHYWRGEFLAARREGDRVRELYDAKRHWRLAQLTNSDPYSGDGVYRSKYLWMLGFTNQAQWRARRPRAMPAVGAIRSTSRSR
jgi:hypothetical protein